MNETLKILIDAYVGHPISVTGFLLIVLAFYLVKKCTEGAVENDMAVVEFVFNGLTPKRWRKKHNKEQNDRRKEGE